MLDFFSTTYSVLSVRIMSVFISYHFLFFFASFRSKRPEIVEDGFNHRYTSKTPDEDILE